MARETDETDEATSHVDRRSLLLALGAGSGVALASTGVGARSQQQDDSTEDDQPEDEVTVGERCSPCVDRFAGYWVPTEEQDGDGLAEVDTSQTVELRISDANVVFQDPVDGADGMANGTAALEGNESAGTEGTVGQVDTETGTPVANQTAIPEANQTDQQEGNQTVGEPGPPMESEGFPDFYFDPVGVQLSPGEVIEFRNVEELHTVTAFHPRYDVQRRIPDGVAGFSSPPMVGEDVWVYRFSEPGVYDIHCLPHLDLGMVMRVVVVEDDGTVPVGYDDPGPEAEVGVPEIPLRVLNTPELDPENIVDQGTVAWTDLTEAASEPPSF